jgi:hypothetical protein
MKEQIKGLLYKVAPRLTTELMSARARAHSHRVIASWGSGRVTRALVERYGSAVQEGPFAGMALTPMAHAEQLGPYLLGVYESELDGAWEIVFRGSYSRVIDIGSKFGYYAVGLARRFPDTPVVAFDTDWWARKAAREMAAANATPNVSVRGFCSPAWLAAHATEADLIVSDCEGYEAALFASETLPRLHAATLLIETHDCFVPGVSARLRADLSPTHAVVEYSDGTGRREPTLPLDFLPERERQLAAHEVRPPQRWLLCLPRTGPNEALHRFAWEAPVPHEG